MRRAHLILSTLLLAAAAPAAAHDLTIGGSRWCIGKSWIVATIDLDSSLLARIDGVGRLQDLGPGSEERLERISSAVLQPYVDRKLSVTVNGERQPMKMDRLVEAGGVWQLWLSAELSKPARSFGIDYGLLFDETGGSHVNLAYVYRSEGEPDGVQRIFDFSQPDWQTSFENDGRRWATTLPAPVGEAVAQHAPTPRPHRRAKAPTAQAVTSPAPVPTLAPPAAVTPEPAPAASAPGEPWWALIARFVVLGVRHILSGYDHIAFLLALIVVAPSLGAVLPIITAFTVAHSITLLLAALGIVHVDSRLVESAIALSICYVAVENLFRRKAAHRWAVTFAFGLVHGFGFASVLQELVVGKMNLVASVVSFNVGVELGQLMIFAVMLPVVRLLGKLTEARKVTVFASVAIGLLGCAWVVERGLDVKLLS